MTLTEEKEEPEETAADRHKRYRELVAKGMSDKEAVESVWPSTTARAAQNAKDKADKLKKDAPAPAQA